MSREAMKLALEALEKVTKHFTRTPSTLMDSEARVEAHSAITALRQALVCTHEELARFAALVAEHERKKRHAAWHEGFEAGRNAERKFCAAVAEWTPDSMGTAHKIADAIRARGEQ